MKLILSLAVLLVALTVMIEPISAQESSSIGDHFRNFGHKLTDFATDIGHKTKKTFEDIGRSKVVTDAKNWFSNIFQKIKEGVSNMSG